MGIVNVFFNSFILYSISKYWHPYVVFIYLANVNNNFDFDKAVEIDRKLKTGKREIIMSTAEKLIERSREEGRLESRLEGRQETLIKTARKVLMKWWS